MKKLLVVHALLFAAMFSADAQVVAGVKGGININNVRYRDSNPNTASVGYYLGALFIIPIGDGLVLQPELLYSKKGYRSPLVGANGQVTSRMNYINLPLLLSVPVATKFQLYAGPEFGYLVKATSKYGSNKDDITDRYQHFDWGLDAGGSYWLTNQLAIDLRYNYGFRGLIRGITTDPNGVPNGSGRDGAHRVFQVGLMYTFTNQNSSGPSGNPRF
ncbi:porin family protein [Paraflavitalea pollutisoli]|uniref:porin family protein n=1 Tax=Paraflavitalea pollutisoli TaxID=3034143 RepID=UPI0023EC3919|nr:porin family protein [Paraflavitalea sp. H1-2-19X]